MLTEQKYPAGEAIRSDPQEESGSENLAPEPVDVGTEFPQPSSAHLADYQIGRYLVGKRLGSGGAASVYQAYDQIQERLVALKILLPGADPAVHSRFRQEARTVARLRHPHIVQTFQVGDAASEGSAYIAMELVDGDSLAQLLKRRGRLSVAESCNLLAPIARALDYAHQQEIVHRDVKPSNILLRPVNPVAFGSSPRNGHSVSAVYEAEQILIGSPTDGENAADRAAEELPVAPLLSDFGIAALDMPELTNVGSTIGTPAYMAPEQCASSREVTGRADIYSLGAVLFRCLVGRPPFTGTTTQILHAHVYSSLSLPDDLLASLPSELVDMLRRSLAKTPQERFVFAKDMADDLTAISDRILSQESSLAEQTSTLTLVSLPSVQLPPSLPHTTDTVIIPGAESRLERSAAQDIPPEPPKVQGAQHAEPTVSKRSRARLIATILGSVLVLALLAIGPAARNALQGNESSATTVSPSSDAAARPLCRLPNRSQFWTKPWNRWRQQTTQLRYLSKLNQRPPPNHLPRWKRKRQTPASIRQRNSSRVFLAKMSRSPRNSAARKAYRPALLTRSSFSKPAWHLAAWTNQSFIFVISATTSGNRENMTGGKVCWRQTIPPIFSHRQMNCFSRFAA